jgi:hypothetical protein
MTQRNTNRLTCLFETMESRWLMSAAETGLVVEGVDEQEAGGVSGRITAVVADPADGSAVGVRPTILLRRLAVP